MKCVVARKLWSLPAKSRQRHFYQPAPHPRSPARSNNRWCSFPLTRPSHICVGTCLQKTSCAGRYRSLSCQPAISIFRKPRLGSASVSPRSAWDSLRRREAGICKAWRRWRPAAARFIHLDLELRRMSNDEEPRKIRPALSVQLICLAIFRHTEGDLPSVADQLPCRNTPAGPGKDLPEKISLALRPILRPARRDPNAEIRKKSWINSPVWTALGPIASPAQRFLVLRFQHWLERLPAVTDDAETATAHGGKCQPGRARGLAFPCALLLF